MKLTSLEEKGGLGGMTMHYNYVSRTVKLDKKKKTFVILTKGGTEVTVKQGDRD